MILLGCATPGVAPTSEACGECHSAHYEEWAASPHARGAASLVFEALLPRAEAAWGTFAADTCVTCHAPAHDGSPNVGCMSCHGATGNHGEHDGQLAVGATIGGLGGLSPAEHTVVPQPLLASDSLCGTCHEVTGPALFVERTLSEHREAGGGSCVSCHAARSDRPLVDGGPARPSIDHRFTVYDPETHARTMAPGIELTWDEGWIATPTPSHGVPTGVGFLRSVRVVGAGLDVELGDQPMRGERPVALITDADAVQARALHGPRPLGGDADEVPEVVGAAYRADVLEALGL